MKKQSIGLNYILKPEHKKTANSLQSTLVIEHKETTNSLQSTLVISKSKGLSEILRDIRTSTYQISRIEEK